MGLDIHISTNNPDDIHTPDYYDEKNDFFNKHSLSREFCNFIGRQNVISHVPELDQIGKLTGIDISPLYDMESYPDEEGLRYEIEYAESEEEKKRILEQADIYKKKLEGNIDKIHKIINQLIERLNQINDLPKRLLPTNFDTLNPEYYFSDFGQDKGDGYISNNFGRDLRNFKRFLEYAKERGTTTVWFHYG